MSATMEKDNEKNSVNGSQKHVAEEIQIPMPWGHVSGKWWGPKDQQPIICLHGWQDNAGTFDTLAPLLSKNVSLLALDLVGHGFSSHLPQGLYYHIFWDGVMFLRKWWGPRGVQPIIALHGRQDNAGSFDNLMPMISTDVSFLCLDLPGHGFSSHLPDGLYYYVHWDGVQVLRRVVKHFKWSKIHILGHSLGGAIGFMYAATFPDDVASLMCLDIASPYTRNLEKAIEYSAVTIEKFLTYENLTLDNVPCYTYEEMIDLVEDAYRGSITRDSAEVMMRRGMMPAPQPGRFYFSRDPRLKSAALSLLSIDIVMTQAKKIKCPYLNIRAIPGMKLEEAGSYQMVVDEIKKNVKKFEYHEIPGTHHVHLNEPEKVAPLIKKFIES